jgi:hypothetical protein
MLPHPIGYTLILIKVYARYIFILIKVYAEYTFVLIKVYFYIKNYQFGMNRDQFNNLQSWKESPYRKPLVVRGARQTG